MRRAYPITCTLLALGLSVAAQAKTNVQPAQQAVCRGADGYAAQGQRTFLWRPEWLAAKKAALATDAALRARLVRTADAALKRGPYSVADKTKPAASGSPNDYLSIGPYWWPDPARPNGMPYKRRDGQVNPERNGDGFDATRFDRFARDVELLALAWHMTGDRRYADHAAGLLRTWFLIPATRMSPNLDHAQAVPGISGGRPEGIIDAIRLTPVVEAIGVIEPSKALNAEEHRRIEGWFGDLAGWMATSANGKAERAASNNHGIYYDMLLAHFALFARMEPVTSRIAGDFGAKRLARQIDAEGKLPAETARTRGWHYSVFTLQAAVRMAMIGECVGQDVWGWTGSEGRSLRKAIDYISGYRTRLDQWPFKDIDLADPERRARTAADADMLFRIAAWGYSDLRQQSPANSASGDPHWLSDRPR